MEEEHLQMIPVQAAAVVVLAQMVLMVEHRHLETVLLVVLALKPLSLVYQPIMQVVVVRVVITDLVEVLVVLEVLVVEVLVQTLISNLQLEQK